MVYVFNCSEQMDYKVQCTKCNRPRCWAVYGVPTSCYSVWCASIAIAVKEVKLACWAHLRNLDPVSVWDQVSSHRKIAVADQ